ncbi:hypothetical protein BH23VER1_BH23VER1_04000 [soil metagenome]
MKSLAKRVEAVTAGGRRYKVAGGRELELLGGLTRAELGEFAREARCHAVVRMGGTIVEFTKAGALYA